MNEPTPLSLDDLLQPAELEALLRRTLESDDHLVVEGRALSGSSNVTVFVSFGGRRLVVRRPPPGELLPTSHDMLREHAFLVALQGSAVPVATPVVAVEDPAVIGAPFYVMERVDGFVIQNDIPDELHAPETLRQLCEAAVDTLADLHAIDWRGLDLPGRPDGYLQRQLKRWTTQLSLTPSASRLDGIDRLTQWVQNNVPPDTETTIVHGDFGLHNLLFQLDGSGGARVGAVMDWEMATLGDPLADLSWFLGSWGGAGAGRSGNPANVVTDWPGALTHEEMFARYAERSGRLQAHADFYRAFSAWKGIVILEGLYSAFIDGNAANPSVARFREQVPTQLAQILAEFGI